LHPFFLIYAAYSFAYLRNLSAKCPGVCSPANIFALIQHLLAAE
jgi:hypothetical protein